MFVTNHVLAGASIGIVLGQRPLGAFAAGFGSHFLMDACPHWGIDYEAEGASDRFLHAARCDGCAGLAAMALGAAAAGRNARRSALFAMFGAVLPDLDKPCKYFFGFSPFPLAFDEFHGWIQRESPDRLRNELAGGSLLLALFVLTARTARRATAPAEQQDRARLSRSAAR